MPTPDPPTTPWTDWKEDFLNHIDIEEDRAEKEVRSRRLAIRDAPNADQQTALDGLRYTEVNKIRDLFNNLGPEAARLFRAKTGNAWQRNNIGDKTLVAALEVCDALFDQGRHPLVALQELYSARQKSGEPIEQFLTRLRHIARPCELGDQEDRRLMECLVFSRTEKEPLDEIVKTHQKYPTLIQVMEILTRHENARRDAPKLLNRSQRPKTDMMAMGPAPSGESDDGNDSYDEEEDLQSIAHQFSQLAATFNKRLQKGSGRNKNYVPRPNRGGKDAQPASGQRNAPPAGGQSTCDLCHRKTCPAKTGGKCFAKGTRCFVCNGMDHWCPSKKKRTNQATITTKIGAAASEENRILLSVGLKPTTQSQQKQEANLLVDTGAQVTTMTEDLANEKFPNLQLRKTKKILSSFHGTAKPAKGKFKAMLSYQDAQPAEITVYVVEKGSLKCTGTQGHGPNRVDYQHTDQEGLLCV